LKTLLNFLKVFFFLLILILFFEAGFQYLYCPVYKFPEPKPFSGNRIFNPYYDMDSLAWKKANFHLHTRSWGGITCGNKTNEFAVDTTYRYLNYDIIGISDYQLINDYRKDQADYVPVYEHGFFPPKNHHLVIGAKKVCWLDLPFPQTLNNEQFVISTLGKDSSGAVVVAHPRMRKAVSVHDMKYLTGYDCIEIFDYLCYSIAHWDSALSAGHIAYATGDDDNHDITDRFLTGMVCTFINLKKLNADSTVDALKKGKMFTCELNMRNADQFADKRASAMALPSVKKIVVENNELQISTDSNAVYFKFVGQGGRVKEIVKKSNQASYNFKPDDTYIRTEIHFKDSTVFYLNPVFRFTGEQPQKRTVILDEKTTRTKRIFFYISIAGLILIAVVYFRKKKPPLSKFKEHEEDSLLNGKIDKPVYFVSKITNRKFFQSRADCEFLKQEGGFLFYRRMPEK
jgi:hypothetical protein